MSNKVVWENPVRDVVFDAPVTVTHVEPDRARQKEWEVAKLRGRWRCAGCNKWATKRVSPVMATRGEANFCQRCIKFSGMKSVWAKMVKLLDEMGLSHDEQSHNGKLVVKDGE